MSDLHLVRAENRYAYDGREPLDHLVGDETLAGGVLCERQAENHRVGEKRADRVLHRRQRQLGQPGDGHTRRQMLELLSGQPGVAAVERRRSADDRDALAVRLQPERAVQHLAELYPRDDPGRPRVAGHAGPAVKYDRHVLEHRAIGQTDQLQRRRRRRNDDVQSYVGVMRLEVIDDGGAVIRIVEARGIEKLAVIVQAVPEGVAERPPVHVLHDDGQRRVAPELLQDEDVLRGSVDDVVRQARGHPRPRGQGPGPW